MSAMSSDTEQALASSNEMAEANQALPLHLQQHPQRQVRQHLQQHEQQRLQQRLQQRRPGLIFEVQASVGSTNSVLLDRARQGSMTPTLLMALAQTQGRGRLGRSWIAQAGASLTFSLALPLPRSDWSGLSLVVGLALAEALDAPAATQPPRIGLKWPNDLVLQSPGGVLPRKLGGILIESLPHADGRLAIIGIGLNVRPMTPQAQPLSAGDALATLSQGYACLQELHPGIDAMQALTWVAEPLLDALDAFVRDGFAPSQMRFALRDVLVGNDLTTTLPDCPSGHSEGIDRDGALLLRVAGQQRRVLSGEVSVRLERSATAATTDPVALSILANAVTAC